MKNKTTVITHSADYDGIFSREIAKKFLGTDNVEYIGWDFPDKPLDSSLLHSGNIVIIDLPVDRIFGLEFRNGWICRGDEEIQPIDRWDSSNIVWIDHHKSSIMTHPASIPGYRIDGVAACRLAWQWFSTGCNSELRTEPCPVTMASKDAFLTRSVNEPYAVTLAGEYDVWKHENSNHDDEAFQFGLDGVPEIHWDLLLDHKGVDYTNHIVDTGKPIMACYNKRDAVIMKTRSFMAGFEGLKFVALTVPRCSSNTFAALDVPETGHDALMAFHRNNNEWSFSLYHAAHRKDIDLSVIARKYGGGGHAGACGFRAENIGMAKLDGITHIHVIYG